MLSSCGANKFSSVTYSIDFRPYAEKGFFISTLPGYSGEYQPVAYMETSLSSGVDKDHPELTIEFSHNGNYTRARYATIGDAIDTLYKKAVDMGADGIINLNLNFKDNAVHLPEITATGMAIKRK